MTIKVSRAKSINSASSNKSDRRIYWIAYKNDDFELSDEMDTKTEAIKMAKECFKEDYEECGYNPSKYGDYYVRQYIETDTEIYFGAEYILHMDIGKRGGITCKAEKR